MSLVIYTTSLGQYNWASTENDWCLALRTPYGNVSELFPEDCPPDVDEDWTLPSEVLDIIEARLDSYWVSTGREKDKAAIAGIRAHAKEIDAAWIGRKIKMAEARLSTLRGMLENVTEEVEA